MRRVAHPWFDIPEDGLLIVNLPERILEVAFDDAMTALTDWYTQIDEPFAMVVDARRTTGISARQRKVIAEADLRFRPTDRMYNAGQAYVIQSALVRGALTAIMWVSPPVYPTRVFENAGTAVAWARAQLAERSVRGSASL